ncbi:KR domain-containing protein [Xylaria acuta]|nr:KR domain-containing protein [Xylaria acuta]
MIPQKSPWVHDTLSPGLSLDRVKKVLRPKVDGAFHLSELFPEDTLDFLLCFSSVAYTNGNAGQSCYGAADAFLAAFIANRRKPGLSFMFEQDFHETLVEGVLSGHSGSPDNLELMTRLRLDGDNSEESRNRSNNPVIQYLVTKSASPTSGNRKTKSVAIKTQLQGTSNEGQVYEIIKKGFPTKLQSSLQADLDKPLAAIGPDELGIDSLLAITKKANDTSSALEENLRNITPVAHVAPVSPSVTSILISPTSDESLVSSLYSKSADQVTNVTVIEKPSSEPPESKESILDSKLKSALSVPMSFPQSGLWSLKHFLESQAALNMKSLVTVKGYLDVARSGKGFIAVGQRHEAICTPFCVNNGNTTEHMQGVLADPVLRLKYEKSLSETDVQFHAQDIGKHNFNVTKGETVRLKLLSLKDNTLHNLLSRISGSIQTPTLYRAD